MKEKLKKVKGWMKTKAARVGMALSVAATALAGTALATEGEAAASTSSASLDTAAITSSFTSGLSQVVTTSVDLISAILPFAISIFAVYFLCRKGMQWFKGMSK